MAEDPEEDQEEDVVITSNSGMGQLGQGLQETGNNVDT